MPSCCSQKHVCEEEWGRDNKTERLTRWLSDWHVLTKPGVGKCLVVIFNFFPISESDGGMMNYPAKISQPKFSWSTGNLNDGRSFCLRFVGSLCSMNGKNLANGETNSSLRALQSDEKVGYHVVSLSSYVNLDGQPSWSWVIQPQSLEPESKSKKEKMVTLHSQYMRVQEQDERKDRRSRLSMVVGGMIVTEMRLLVRESEF